MTHEERIADIPPPLRWFLVAFKNVGFPVIVCIYLAYMQFVDGKEQRNTLLEFKEVISSLRDSIDQQNKILRRKRADE